MPQLEQTLPAPGPSSPCAPPTFFACTWSAPEIGPACIRVAGELDIATSPQLDRALRGAWDTSRLVLLDLRELTFMDGFGVHVIVEASRSAHRGARRLVMLRPPIAVQAVFDLTEAFGEVEVVDLDPAQPPVQALLMLSRRSVPES